MDIGPSAVQSQFIHNKTGFCWTSKDTVFFFTTKNCKNCVVSTLTIMPPLNVCPIRMTTKAVTRRQAPWLYLQARLRPSLGPPGQPAAGGSATRAAGTRVTRTHMPGSFLPGRALFGEQGPALLPNQQTPGDSRGRSSRLQGLCNRVQQQTKSHLPHCFDDFWLALIEHPVNF